LLQNYPTLKTHDNRRIPVSIIGFLWQRRFIQSLYTLLIYYTDGIKWLQENANCYWLTDLIASYQTTAFKKANDRQFWKLVVTDSSAVITCDDGDGNISVTQAIEYTDFPLPSLSIWVEIQEEGRIFIYLPSEY
jgi:hypothetical protein